MNYWLMKSEPDAFSWDDLVAKGRAEWDGVRNHLAQSHMKAMKTGDRAFFYHSNADPSGVAGVMKIVGEAKPDLTQFDSKSKYYDETAAQKEPRWFLREVAFVKKINFVSLDQIRKSPACKKMFILQKGSRLSITPVTETEWNAVLKLGQ